MTDMTSIDYVILEVDDVIAAERFYVERGHAVAKSFARTYAEFAAPSKHIRLGIYKRRALAKDAAVSADGTGSHRLVIGSDAGPFTDPDGFPWEATVRRSAPDVGNGRPDGDHHQPEVNTVELDPGPMRGAR